MILIAGDISLSVEDWDGGNSSMPSKYMGRTVPSFRIALAMEEGGME
jgi:hypothetical protein